MKTMLLQHLETLLQIVACGQLFIATLNLFLERILGWKPALDAMPLLVREVFKIHSWFITLTCGIFGMLTFRFAGAIARHEHPMLAWFAAAVGFFWALRCVMQWTHYSQSHWKGILRETIIHWTLFIGYGLWASVYFFAALG